METTLTVVRQVFIILVLLAFGAFTYKKKFISVSTADDMAGFCLRFVTPCVIIEAFQMEFEVHKLFNMLIAAILALLTHIIGIAIAKIAFKKGVDGNNIRRFAAIYCNCGFMGIPLIQGAVGNEGVLYSSVYIVVFQAIMWSHGVLTVRGGSGGFKKYKIFINAGTIGIAIGLPLFFMSVKLPPVVSESVHYIANLNTPLAMIISGVYIAKSNVKQAFLKLSNYFCVAIRQLITPLIMLAIMLIMRPDESVALTLLIISACPVASAATMFASVYGKNGDLETASQIFTLSNLLSVVTIPLVILIYGLLY